MCAGERPRSTSLFLGKRSAYCSRLNIARLRGARHAFVWYRSRTIGLGPFAITELPSPYGIEFGGRARATLASELARPHAHRAPGTRT